MAEPIQMPFRVVIHEGQRNHVLDGCPDALGGSGKFGSGGLLGDQHLHLRDISDLQQCLYGNKQQMIR